MTFLLKTIIFGKVPVLYFVYTIADQGTKLIAHLKYVNCSPLRGEENAPGLKAIRHL
jgi:hypothetical protein